MIAIAKLDNRPKSLAEVALDVSEGQDYASAVKEFIDEIISSAAAPTDPYGFYQIPSSHYEDEPDGISDPILRVHLAGLAENLATISGQQPPDWSEKEAYFLREPVYVGGRRSRGHLTSDTPAAFRRRLLFCGPSLSKLFKIHPRPVAA